MTATAQHAIGDLNLILAWLWILAGFGVGAGFGLKFHREDWLGGYASFRRRLYRLGHISFFGLAIINLMFCLTARTWDAPALAATVASWGFLVSAVAMPASCFLVAHQPKCRAVFAIPVTSLIVAGTLTLWEVAKL